MLLNQIIELYGTFRTGGIISKWSCYNTSTCMLPENKSRVHTANWFNSCLYHVITSHCYQQAPINLSQYWSNQTTIGWPIVQLLGIPKWETCTVCLCSPAVIASVHFVPRILCGCWSWWACTSHRLLVQQTLLYTEVLYIEVFVVTMGGMSAKRSSF
jgi:hypothetical protein